MPYAVDRFSVLYGVVIVTGWSSDQEGGALTILHDGSPIATTTVSEPRPDLEGHFGESARQWGFRAYAVLQNLNAPVTKLGVRFPSGLTIGSLSLCAPRADDNSHELFQKFVEEVNSTGGRVLEVGSRARSGVSRRELFGESVEYTGTDLISGPNVDVVSDAHHLSVSIQEKFNYIFSMSTFEHFLMPWKVVLELNKLLDVGGKVFSHSHQTWPSHEEPWDYFRFSRESWGGLYNSHTGFRICDARRGEAVVITSAFNPGGPFEKMDRSPGYGMSVCIAEKIGEPVVQWEAPMSDIQVMKYSH